MGMNTLCPNLNCNYNLAYYPITIELDGRYRVLYCPLCGSKIESLSELPMLGISYDEEAEHYIKWVPPQNASAQEEVEELKLNRLTIKVHARTKSYREIFYDAVLVFTLNDQIIPHQ